ncbi:MAG TPA: homoserine dehydrogenase [Vicinamibacterales bacterium]
MGSCFRVALLGFGTVGSAVARRLTASTTDPGLRLTHIFDRRADAKRHLLGHAHGVRWTSNIDDILHSDADLVVEAVGGLDSAASWIGAALLAGKSVVTANKQVIAAHGVDLLRLAARQGRQLRFEAAVGGAMPIVRAIADGLSGDCITRIVAILNGTTNAVLSQMEADDCSLETALAEAQATGYAEVDPSTDLDGGDASAKLAILCALAFGIRIEPSQIATRTSATVSTADVRRLRDQHQSIRQIAFADYDRGCAKLTAWVAPTAVPSDSLLGRTVGPRNAALITGEHSGEVGLFGAGAGGAATAVAVIGDIVAIARDPSAIVPALTLTTDFSVRKLLSSDFTLPTSDYAEAL